jgi:hypothetical protein
MSEENGKKVFRKIGGSTVCFRNGEPQGEARENLLKWEAEKKIKIVEPKALENKTLTDTEKEHVKMFLLGKPVAELKSGIIKAGEGERIGDVILDWAEKNICGTIYSEDIGKIVIARSGIRHSLHHGFGSKKIDAIPAIPSVIEKGETVNIRTATKDYPKTEILKAAPISIDGKTTIMIVRLRKVTGEDIRFYLHEVWTLEEAKQGKLQRSGTPIHQSRNQTSEEFSSFLSILQDIFNVKEKIAKDAADWVAAIEAELYFGDIERRIWGHFRAKEEAALEVMPILGEISPFVYDSAEDIYGEALSRTGWDIAQYPKEAYRGMIVVLLGMRGIKV